MVKTIFHEADTRGHADHGWLNAHHSFSFAQWQNKDRVHFGALRVLNDDIVQKGVGFGEHPHDNMEIISIVLEGKLAHKDTMGNVESIRLNEVQVMSAGSGLEHSEFNHSKTDPVNLLQIWIFPKLRNIAPRYEQKYFEPSERQDALQTLVAPTGTPGQALTINQDAWIYRANLEAGKELKHTLKNTGNGVYVFLIDGAITMNDQPLNKRDAIGIWDTDGFTMSATKDSDILLIEVPMEF